MDRAAFFAALRSRASKAFGTSLSKGQVNGMNAILDGANRRGTPLRHLAYILATSYHETAHTMQPIHERGPRSYFDKYDAGTKIGKALGNTVKGDGYLYRGRGFVQLTGRSNYARASNELGVDLINIPDRALELTIATQILFCGMEQGWFTSRKMTDYLDGLTPDYKNARRIINGTDKAALIAGYAEAFAAALNAGGYTGQAHQPLPTPTPRPEPVIIVTTPVPEPQPTKDEPQGFWGWLRFLLGF